MKKVITSTLFTVTVLASSFTMKSCSQSENAETGEELPVEQENVSTAETQDASSTVDYTGPMVEIVTEFGTMKAVLFDDTPQHRDNFIKLAKAGFYDGTLFHRVIKGFMIQGGDPESKGAPADKQLGSGGPGYTIPAEINPRYFHQKGALSAARQGDQVNPLKASSGSQFYVVQGTIPPPEQLEMMGQQKVQQQKHEAFMQVLQSPGHETDVAEFQKIQQARDQAGYDAMVLRLDAEIAPILATKATGDSEAQKIAYGTVGGTPQLDGGYTVFGQVLEGLEVIDAIANQQTAPGDRPVTDIKMTVRVIE